MKNKIVEMLKLQKGLDTRILDGAEYPLYQMRVAYYVEIGEMLNEMPTVFKHWKKTAVDNREKALVEAVDCVHFWLSMWLSTNGTRESERKYNRLAGDIEAVITTAYNNQNTADLAMLANNAFSSWMFGLFPLLFGIGFTFDEIYEGYLAKNEVNHQRQNDGY